MIKSMRKLMILLTAMLIGFGSFVISTAHVYAGGESLEYDKTNVLDDLRSSTAGGSAFNINDYPFDSTGLIKHPGIIGFIEYCYSFRENKRVNFGLYLYVYNPQALNFDTASRGNKVELAVAYDADGIPNDYEKFDLVFCNKSEESNYKNLFYKFRIKDHKSADGKYIADRVNSNERRYDLVGIELVTYGATNAEDYAMGGTYKFTGYSAGYGPDPDAESSLKCAINELETIELEVGNTLFRTTSSSLGAGHQSDLNSVYFSVDNSIIQKYGKLQEIKAEWYEYKTAPVVVVQDSAVYNQISAYKSNNLTSYNSDVGYSLYTNFYKNPAGAKYFNWAWNPNIPDWSYSGMGFNISNRLYNLFCTDGVSVVDYFLSKEELTNYIYNYNASYDSGTLPIKSPIKPISADLFESVVDPERIRGYNVANFNSDDRFDLLSYDSTHNDWQKFWDYFGNWGIDTSSAYYGKSPICEVSLLDFVGIDETVSKNLLIHKSDVAVLRSYTTAESIKNKTVFLFRFAQTDYYSEYATIEIPEKFLWIFDNTQYVKNKAFMAQETVFLDFDIIQLTFNRDGVYRVIPVVSSPIDIINGITAPPDDGIDWLMIILMLLALLLIIVFIIAILPQLLTFVFGFAGGVVKIPVKVIKSTKKRRRRRR